MSTTEYSQWMGADGNYSNRYFSNYACHFTKNEKYSNNQEKGAESGAYYRDHCFNNTLNLGSSIRGI